MWLFEIIKSALLLRKPYNVGVLSSSLTDSIKVISLFFQLLILHRAFYREVLQNTAAVGLLILFVFLVIRVVGYLRLAAEGVIPANSVLLLLLLRLLSHLDIIVPLAVYVAMLLVLGRWSRDRELIVAAAAGVGVTSFIRPTLYLSVVLGIFVAAFSLYLSPLAVQKGDSVQHEFRLRSDVTAILPGVFTENVQGDGVYFVETHDSDTDTYHNIFAWGSMEGVEGIVVASSAQHLPADDESVVRLELNDGGRYDVRPGEAAYQSIFFDKYILPIDNRGTPATRNRLEAWPLYIHDREDEPRDLWHHVGKRPDGTKGNVAIRSEIASSDERILIHISNFRRVKRVDDVIKVFNKVHRKVKSKLLMIGDGPERVKAENLARELNISDSIFFMGKRKSVEDFLSVSDLFLDPAHFVYLLGDSRLLVYSSH